ncbi:MAG TPA: PAS domain-containing protein [Clostridium sp.]|uniref:PAS domain-containing protein n=1 Tax=Clostridium sp. TaxID=1506 RepID=UPI002F941644
MKNTFNNKIIKPCFYSSANIITNISNDFLNLTEYAFDELLGKSLIEIGELLKINSQMFLHNIISEYIGYIFTKSLSAREVIISLLHDDVINQDIYTFIEIPNSRLDDKLSFVKHTFIDNILGAAVYSVPDLILLKSNQKYLDFMDSPFNKEENSIGSPISEIITGFVKSQSEDIWDTIIATQKPSYVKEFEFDKFERGITYWDATREPIFGKVNMKYIFETVTDVTKRVFKNRNIVRQHNIIMQQNKSDKEFSELIGVIENLSEGILLMNNKGRFLMINSEAKRLVYKYDVETYIFEALKKIKMFDMKGNEIPLNDFPSVRALRGEKIKNAKVFMSHPNNEYFIEISSTPIYNTNGILHMVVTCFHDITETINQSRKIEDHKNELEGIIENLAESISIFDNKGKFILFNKAARQRYSPSYKNPDGIDDIYNKYGFYDVLGNKIDPENIPARRVMRGELLKNMRISVKFPHETLQKDVSGTPIYDS